MSGDMKYETSDENTGRIAKAIYDDWRAGQLLFATSEAGQHHPPYDSENDDVFFSMAMAAYDEVMRILAGEPPAERPRLLREMDGRATAPPDGKAGEP